MQEEPDRGLFIGIGVDHYVSDQLQDLNGTADEVAAVADVVGDHYIKEVLRDADVQTIRDTLLSWQDHFAAVAGALIMVWSGHGRTGVGASGLRLLGFDSEDRPTEGIDSVDVAIAGAATGAHQILFVVDTCFAGNALEALAQVKTYMHERPPAGEPSWFGMLFACGPETVREHLLLPALERLLRDGPRSDDGQSKDIRRRWSVRNHLISGEDLIDALVKEWNFDSAPTQPDRASVGDSRPMIRNPLWSSVAGPALVREVLTGDAPTPKFFGRETALSAVSEWADNNDHGVFTIVGTPGSGKSALLQQLSLPSLQSGVGNDSIGPRAMITIDVSGMSADRIVATIDRNLVARGVIEDFGSTRNVFDLCGALKRRAIESTAVPTVSLDGLSSTADPADAVIAVISPLSMVVRLVVATRPITLAVPRQRATTEIAQRSASSDVAEQVPITDALSMPDAILNLDDEQNRASGWLALEELLDDQLGAAAPDGDPSALVAALREEVGPTDPPPLVLANLIIDEANELPHREFTVGEASITASIGAVLDRLITSRSGSSDKSLKIHELLEALSLGLGSGLPDAEWLAIANARRESNEPLDRDDVDAALTTVSQYVTEDAESGQAVYRFAHPLIAEHFLQGTPNTPDAELRCAAALISASATLGASAQRTFSPHLSKYLWRYAARAGEPGLSLLRRNPLFAADLAPAALAVSIDAAQRGDLSAATEHAQEAVRVARDLVGEERDGSLGPALLHLAALHQARGEIAQAVANGKRALETFSELAASRPERIPDFAAAAHNLANMLMDAQDPLGAVDAALRAVALEEEFLRLGAENRYRLGIARNTLALAYSMAGRRQDAIEASRNAVEVLESAASVTSRPQEQAALAQALQNLGSHLADTGETGEALSTTIRARDIAQELVQADTQYQASLSEALNDLAVRYRQSGESGLALETATAAVNGFRGQGQIRTATGNARYAGSLTNFANLLMDLGRAEAAVAPAREAVTVMRGLADRQAAWRPSLALTLDNFANALTHNGFHDDARAASEEALALYRAARISNPGLDADIARVLLNYSQRLFHAGRSRDAAAAGVEAIHLIEQLAAEDPRMNAEAAIARSNVAVYVAQGGDPMAASVLALQAVIESERLAKSEGMSLGQLAVVYVQASKATMSNSQLSARYGQRAVEVFRQAGMTDTAEYATAMRNLAALHGMENRNEAGLAAIDEAVQIFRRLLDVDGSFRGSLATALGVRAQLLLALRRSQAAAQAAIDSADSYSQLPGLDVDGIDQCAKTLLTLALALRDLDGDMTVLDTYVRQCLRNLGGRERALLLGHLVNGLPIGHPRAPGWIYQAIVELNEDDPLIRLSLGSLARRLRPENTGAFDALWEEASQSPVPGWAKLDPERIEWVKRWVNSGNYTAAERFLHLHPHLAESDYDSAVDEAFIPIEPARALAMRHMRAHFAGLGAGQRTSGPEFDLADRFLDVGLIERLTVLSEHFNSLGADVIGQYLRARQDHTSANAAISLIELRRYDLDTEIASAASDSGLAETTLARIAGTRDAKTLRRAGIVLLDHAQREEYPEVGIVASFFVAIGMLIDPEFSEQGRELVADVVTYAPHEMTASVLLTCQRLAGVRPEFDVVTGAIESVGPTDG
jgi:tetratricopeptide (TPR) repeat protein